MIHSALLRAISYDPETGIFKRKVAAGNCAAGSVVGNLDAKGYLKAMVQGHYVRLNRLAWFYTYGVWPTYEVDHINQIKTDNRITNLRDCETSTNCLNQTGPIKNNKTGLQGVHRIQKTGRYRAACSVNGKKHHLGVFTSAEEASVVYQQFKSAYLP